MLLGFRDRFVPFVENGKKTHTIRKLRKRPPQVGQMCDCYARPRQKDMRLLGRWPCVKVDRVFICRARLTVDVYVNDRKLSIDEKNDLAWNDGYRDRGLLDCFGEMVTDWLLMHGTNCFPFEGHLIHWER